MNLINEGKIYYGKSINCILLGLFIIFRYFEDILLLLFFTARVNVLECFTTLAFLIRKGGARIGRGSSNGENRVASFYQLNIIKFCLGLAPSLHYDIQL